MLKDNEYQRKPRLVHIISSLGVGGAERALSNLLEGQLMEDFECVVVSLKDGGRYSEVLQNIGIEVVCLNLTDPRRLISGLKKLKAVLKDVNPDIIQGWMYHGNLTASVFGLLYCRGTPIFWNVRHCVYSISHEKLLTRIVLYLSRWLSKYVSQIVYNSSLARKQHEQFGYSKNGVVIPNGFDLRKWKYEPASRESIRLELGLPLNALIIGHIGRYHPMKDHINYIRSIAQISSKLPNAYFLFVGREVDQSNPILKPFFELVPKYKVRCLGERQDVERILSAIDVFCLSSWSEAFPNVIGEAMATGIPCVSTDVGDSLSIIGDTGIVVPPRDHCLLSEALLSICNMGADRRSALGIRARERIGSLFDTIALQTSYRNIYLKFIDK